ncbi:hypothetical protein AVEN_246700-1, partial [Araneus ventricosus]
RCPISGSESGELGGHSAETTIPDDDFGMSPLGTA